VESGAETDLGFLAVDPHASIIEINVIGMVAMIRVLSYV
jgi:hypothetical protein